MDRRNARLILIEQIIMILVFSFSAAICVKAFVKADSINKKSVVLDEAVIECQRTCEILNCYKGDIKSAAAKLQGEVDELKEYLEINYDENWDVTRNGGRYKVIAEITEGNDNEPGSALVYAKDMEDGVRIFEIKTAWQEE